MRPMTRAALVGAVLLVFLFSSLLTYHRDDWRDHLNKIKFRPSSFHWSSKGDHITLEDALSKPDLGDNSQKSADGSHAENKSPTTESSSNHDAAPHPVIPPAKAVVMARLSTEDTSWVETELSDWAPFIYTVNDTSAPLHTAKNKGRESLAYLTYIVDNYHQLGDTVAFIHSHKDGYPLAWHTDAPDYSNVKSLQTLQTSYVQETGYANLRCNNEVGCSPPEMQLKREPKEDHRTAELAMPEAWTALIGEEVPLPDTIGAACCAQFAVSKQQIRRRPLVDYQRYLQWVLDTEHPDDVSGRIMEYLWHVIFGRDAVYCPELKTCYCNVYGRDCGA